MICPIWTDDAHDSSLGVRATEGEPSGREELAALLLGWLRRVGIPLKAHDD
jgi:hypothetical protein